MENVSIVDQSSLNTEFMPFHNERVITKTIDADINDERSEHKCSKCYYFMLNVEVCLSQC
jgi:hypothetical protein